MEEQNTKNSNMPEQSDSAPKAESSDAEKNKVMAIVGYIVPILFFVPLINDSSKNSPFAKFHAGQQLNLLLFWVLGWIVSAVLMIILIGFLLEFIVWIAGIVFMILGIVAAAKGEMKPLPLIGGIKIL
ncbi:MAG: DUF4870 domain-containing protein [Candidatus Pacebacteria bacterium]|nr:DUF4870 domain-containing protein [Candidatus Paceibacterota bacterium]MDR3583226.1 DUF4870 domain-containing protein [Candidatus Paceibacterota bacterium]